MTAQSDRGHDLRHVLALTDRNQKFAIAASLAGYVIWLAATFRFVNLVKQSSLSPDVAALLQDGALLMLFGGFATQFMVCNYINQMARRILRAIHLTQRPADPGAGEQS